MRKTKDTFPNSNFQVSKENRSTSEIAGSFTTLQACSLFLILVRLPIQKRDKMSKKLDTYGNTIDE